MGSFPWTLVGATLGLRLGPSLGLLSAPSPGPWVAHLWALAGSFPGALVGSFPWALVAPPPVPLGHLLGPSCGRPRITKLVGVPRTVIQDPEQTKIQ